EALGDAGDLVTVAHPDVETEQAVGIHVILDAVEQAALADHVDARIAELTQVGALDLAAELLGHGLHAVANAQHRHAQVEHRLTGTRAALCMHRLRPAGEDDAARVEGANVLVAHVPGMQFAVHADLADPTGDRRVLRTA